LRLPTPKTSAASRFWLRRFSTPMSCGVGACRGCQSPATGLERASFSRVGGRPPPSLWGASPRHRRC
jgi:hypothetical protein